AGERQLWSLWLGCVLACLLLRGVVAQLPGFEAPELAWATYPFVALLTGVAFFALGGRYWGPCCGFGVGFFALAVLMPRWLEGASLAFGLLWASALAAIGLRLRRL